jgi:hypothetical protein
MDWRDWIALFTLVIAAVTIMCVCAFFFYHLWEATNESLRALRMSVNIARESLELSRQVFEATSRPFLVFTDLRLHKNDPASFSFGITIRNKGNGVAYQLSETVTIFLDNRPIRDSGHAKEVPVLPPQGGTSYELTVEGADAEAVWNETKSFEVEARVDYSSGTGQRYAKRDRWCWNSRTRMLDLLESTEEVESVRLFADGVEALDFPIAASTPRRAERAAN